MKLHNILLIILAIVSLTSLSSALSDTDKAVIKLSVFTALDDTNDFNYVKADVDYNDDVTIWYIPKETDTESTARTLGEVIGAYLGMCRIYDVGDLKIYIGTQGAVSGEMYCLRSWVGNGYPSDEEAAALVLTVLGTFEET